jgi:hypothetical protein
MRTEAGTGNSERFVEMLGLKTLFSLFMGKVSEQQNVAIANNSERP